jgi:single-strand DNA-binding protein
MAINRVVLVGRLTRDPELKYTPTGKAVATLGLAVDDPYRKKQDGSGEFETNFFNVVAWERSAEFAANYLSKGRLVAVDGRLQYRSWTAQDGSKRSVVEVVADRLQGLDKPREAAGEPAETGAPPRVAEPAVDMEDDLGDPFSDQ